MYSGKSKTWSIPAFLVYSPLLQLLSLPRTSLPPDVVECNRFSSRLCKNPWVKNEFDQIKKLCFSSVTYSFIKVLRQLRGLPRTSLSFYDENLGREFLSLELLEHSAEADNRTFSWAVAVPDVLWQLQWTAHGTHILVVTSVSLLSSSFSSGQRWFLHPEHTDTNESGSCGRGNKLERRRLPSHLKYQAFEELEWNQSCRPATTQTLLVSE